MRNPLSGLISLFTFLFFIPQILQAQVSRNSELFNTLRIQDSMFFERGFNRCDLEYLKMHTSDSLRFYHDQNGMQDKGVFLENTQKYLCSNAEIKPIRKPQSSSFEVFPLYHNGNLYGAVQSGIHHFYIRETGKKDRWTASARFTHVWLIENEIWKIREVLSFDHQSTQSPDPDNTD